jgi:hypothetical protein
MAPEDDFGEVAIYNIYNLNWGYREDAADTLLILKNIIITGAK